MKRIFSFSTLFLAALLMHVTLLTQPAQAQTGSPAPKSEIQTQFHQAFWEMLADPANVEKTVRYAELAVKIGDYEAAIPPLERLLMLNPNLSEVRLEVGVLYFLLNSREAARGYFTDVKQDPTANAALIKRADDYLARM